MNPVVPYSAPKIGRVGLEREELDRCLAARAEIVQACRACSGHCWRGRPVCNRAGAGDHLGQNGLLPWRACDSWPIFIVWRQADWLLVLSGCAAPLRVVFPVVFRGLVVRLFGGAGLKELLDLALRGVLLIVSVRI